MKNNTENYRDSSLENIVPILYMSSVIVGILRLITGLFLIIKNNNTQNKGMKLVGVACVGIGFFGNS